MNIPDIIQKSEAEAEAIETEIALRSKTIELLSIAQKNDQEKLKIVRKGIERLKKQQG